MRSSNKRKYLNYIRGYLSEICNLQYETEKDFSEKSRIHTRISDIFSLRPDLIQQCFDKSDFVFADYKKLIRKYNTTIIEAEEVLTEDTIEEEQPTIKDLEEQLSKVRTEILKYESG